jgi:hypothetical protein
VDSAQTSGSVKVRIKPSAWRARLLLRQDKVNKGTEFSEHSIALGGRPNTEISDALMSSQIGGKLGAFETPAGIDFPASRSVGLLGDGRGCWISIRLDLAGSTPGCSGSDNVY